MTLAYFKQTLIGRSQWWSWIMGVWLFVIGAIIMQTLVTMPILIVAAFEGEAFFDALMATTVTAPPTQSETLRSQILLVTVGLGLVGSLITLTADGKIKHVAGWVAAFGIAISTVLGIMAMMGQNSADFSAKLMELMGRNPVAYLLFLLTFPAVLVPLYIIQKFVHQRTILSLHSAFKRFGWRRVIQSFLVTWAVLAMFSFAASLLGLGEFDTVFDPSRFWVYAVVSLLFIPLQAATEEIVFRGYLNQALTHVTKSMWVAFIITSTLFMAMHLANPEALDGAAKGILPLVMSGYFFFGFACCLLVWIDNGLESAIGVHAANNCFAAIFINYEGSVLPTPSVFLTKPNATMDSITTIIVLSVIVLILWKFRRREKTPINA